jgi:hypothetical protein
MAESSSVKLTLIQCASSSAVMRLVFGPRAETYTGIWSSILISFLSGLRNPTLRVFPSIRKSGFSPRHQDVVLLTDWPTASMIRRHVAWPW